jgi:hypothetical protein
MTSAIALYDPDVARARMAGDLPAQVAAAPGLAELWTRLRGNAADFTNANRGAILKGGGLLTGLGVLSGAAGALSNPEESKLSNAVGATANAAGGFGGLIAGTMAGGRLGAGLGPWGALAGGALGAAVGSGALEGIARAGVGLFEDPSNKAIRDQAKQRAMLREQAVLDLQARLPVELEAAAARATIDNRIARQNAEIEGQKMLQQAMAQGILQRTQAEGAQNLAMTQNIMQGIFG